MTKSLSQLVRRPGPALLGTLGVAKEFQALDFARGLPAPPADSPRLDRSEAGNPLWDYFEANATGPGIVKWRHYFEIYHRHLRKFVGREARIVEIGVYSGGSLGMWRSYLGDKTQIVGIDIDPVCKVYENDYTKIVIGDQEDRSFWRKFWAETGPVDILLDDGGHTHEQQIATLEECLPNIRPGGVFICEDIHRSWNLFTPYLNGLNRSMHEWTPAPKSDSAAELVDMDITASPFQSQIHSMHLYPYIAVIEKHERPFTHLAVSRRGTEWQPIQF
ncbi:class I SAM-dependent methyltransferase [Paludisphaera sp.]|uniref:class I SAM-dependent methyltransferase n=1 Tax=Paludisphaera sp. TaxID=2017432 RepID=UPI00301BFFB2